MNGPQLYIQTKDLEYRFFFFDTNPPKNREYELLLRALKHIAHVNPTYAYYFYENRPFIFREDYLVDVMDSQFEDVVCGRLDKNDPRIVRCPFDAYKDDDMSVLIRVLDAITKRTKT
jgi:hypothetical protein